MTDYKVKSKNLTEKLLGYGDNIATIGKATKGFTKISVSGYALTENGRQPVLWAYQTPLFGQFDAALATSVMHYAYAWAKESYRYDTASIAAYLKHMEKKSVTAETASDYARVFLNQDKSNQSLVNYITLHGRSLSSYEDLKSLVKKYHSEQKKWGRLYIAYDILLSVFDFLHLYGAFLGAAISIVYGTVLGLLGGAFFIAKFDLDLDRYRSSKMKLLHARAKLTCTRTAYALKFSSFYHRELTKIDHLISLVEFVGLLRAEKWQQALAKDANTVLRDLYDNQPQSLHPLVKHFIEKLDKGEQIDTALVTNIQRLNTVKLSNQHLTALQNVFASRGWAVWYGIYQFIEHVKKQFKKIVLFGIVCLAITAVYHMGLPVLASAVIILFFTLFVAPKWAKVFISMLNRFIKWVWSCMYTPIIRPIEGVLGVTSRLGLEVKGMDPLKADLLLIEKSYPDVFFKKDMEDAAQQTISQAAPAA